MGVLTNLLKRGPRLLERESLDVRRLQLSFRSESGEVIEALSRHLGADVDPLDTSLGEVVDRCRSLHRGDRSAFADRLGQSSQASSIAARVDDRRHSSRVLGLERFEHIVVGAIDNLVGAQAFHVFGLAFARDAEHMSAGGGCQLDGVGSDSTGGADDHDHIVGSGCNGLDRHQRRNAGEGKCCGRDLVDFGRTLGDGGRRRGRELGQRAFAHDHLPGDPEDWIADRKAIDARADRVDCAGEVG